VLTVADSALGKLQAAVVEWPHSGFLGRTDLSRLSSHFFQFASLSLDLSRD
jgi:hypothetical protein